MRTEAVFAINGQVIRAGAEDASLMLADFLRRRRQLTGTKIVCAEGDCGACTVLKAAPYSSKRRSSPGRYLPVNSCIIPVASLDGSSIVTVDGLAPAAGAAPADQPPPLHPVQEAMVRCHGSQCGFCTPGFVMALAGLVEKRIDEGSTTAPISEREARNALTANLCRCTGYTPILEAACSISLDRCGSVRERHDSPTIRKELRGAIQKPLRLESDEFRFFAPTRMADAARFLKQHPDAKVVSGATDLGVVHNKRKARLEQVLSLHLIPELYAIRRIGKTRLRIGAQVTLSELRNHLKNGVIPEFATFLDLFASPQIKNQATLVGNLATASPIGDTPPFLLVAGAVVHAWNPRATGTARTRKIPIEEFFVGYRKTALKRGEWITAVEIDIPAKGEVLRLRKVSQRKDLDISTVNAAFRVRLHPKKRVIEEARIALGGVAARTVRLDACERLMRHRKPEEVDAAELQKKLQEAITPMTDLRSSAAFRRVVAGNLLETFLKELRA